MDTDRFSMDDRGVDDRGGNVNAVSVNTVIVREQSAVAGLTDGIVYVLAAKTDPLVNEAWNAVRRFKKSIESQGSWMAREEWTVMSRGAGARGTEAQGTDVENADVENADVEMAWKEMAGKETAGKETGEAKAARVMAVGKGLIYSYNVRVIEDAESVITRGGLHEAIRKGANLVLPVSTPNVLEKQYVVARGEAGALDAVIRSMAMQAEDLTRKAVADALMNLGVQEPESCGRVVGEWCMDALGADLEEWDDAPVGDAPEAWDDAPSVMKCCAEGDFTCRQLEFAVGAVPYDTSYRESCEIMGRFVENCRFINRAEKRGRLSKVQTERLQRARSEVNYVFNLFTPSVYSRFALQMMRKNDIALAFDNCINREKIAAGSRIVVSVEPARPDMDAMLDPKSAKKLKTNGKFRVYLSDGVETVQVKFARAASCIVYMMYLLDRKHRGEEIDTLRIADNEQLFCELYGRVYNEYDAKDTFRTLKSRFEDGKVKRSRLTDCYSDIRSALSDAVAGFGESALPFYIPNEYSHITVLGSNISVPEDFLRLGILTD